MTAGEAGEYRDVTPEGCPLHRRPGVSLWHGSPGEGLCPVLWGSETRNPAEEVTLTAPGSLPVVPGAVSQAEGELWRWAGCAE